MNRNQEIVDTLHDKILGFWSIDDDTTVEQFLTGIGREACKLIIDGYGLERSEAKPEGEE